MPRLIADHIVVAIVIAADLIVVATIILLNLK
jgi:hypothetical protein